MTPAKSNMAPHRRDAPESPRRLRPRPLRLRGAHAPATPMDTKRNGSGEATELKTTNHRHPVIESIESGAPAVRTAPTVDEIQAGTIAGLPGCLEGGHAHAPPTRPTSPISEDGEREYAPPAVPPSPPGRAPDSPGASSTQREASSVSRPIPIPVERVMNETPELSTNNGERTGVNVPTSNSFECLRGNNPDGEPSVGTAAPTSHDSPGERRPCGVAPAEFLTQDGYTLVTYRSERKLKKPTDQIDKLYTVLFHPSLESRPFEATQRSKISKEIRSAFSKTAVTNIRLNPSKNILAVDTPYIETRDRLLLVRNLVRIPVRSFPATPTNASVGTVHGMAGEHSLQVIRTMVEAKGTILDIARKGKGTSIFVFFEGPSMPDHVTLGPRWYRVYPAKEQKNDSKGSPSRPADLHGDAPTRININIGTATSRKQPMERQTYLCACTPCRSGNTEPERRALCGPKTHHPHSVPRCSCVATQGREILLETRGHLDPWRHGYSGAPIIVKLRPQSSTHAVQPRRWRDAQTRYALPIRAVTQ